MQFQVPQFIEVEDKIFGPLTFKQFVYLAGGAGVIVVLYTFLPLFLTILLGAPVVIFVLALAFYKVNNRPFVHVLEAAFNYMLSRKLYLWKHEQKIIPRKIEETKKELTPYVPKLSENKLKDIAWSLDIQESIYSKKDQQK